MSCLIEINDLSFQYPDGRVALNNIFLHIKHGQRVGLVGPNGAGKTSLFHVLSGVSDSFTGSVNVADCDLSTPKGRQTVHKKLGIVFQQTDDQIIHPSVLEDIAFGPLNLGLDQDEIFQRVRQAMHDVGLDQSYEERVPYHLSGGEKRRVTIAGILAMQPDVLLLDEPSSDLDPRGRRELVAILDRLPITRMISSHHLEFIMETCERVIVLNEGKLIADGLSTDILSNSQLMNENGLEVPGNLR